MWFALYFYWTELAKAPLDFHSSGTRHSLYFLLCSFRAIPTKPGPVLSQHCREMNKAHPLSSAFPVLYHTHTHTHTHHTHTSQKGEKKISRWWHSALNSVLFWKFVHLRIIIVVAVLVKCLCWILFKSFFHSQPNPIQ